MIDQPLSRGHDPVIRSEAPARSDRAMEALQYLLAFVAIVAAALLASVR